ncbi:MAG: hypothetical protein ACQEQV_08030 [Fibrobacterota bacterium]
MHHVRTIGIFLLTTLTFLAAQESLLAVPYATGIDENFGTYRSAHFADTAAQNLMRGTPSNLASVDKSAYSFTFNLSMTHLYTDTEASDFISADPTYFGIALPLGKAGALGVSYQRKSHQSYSYFSGEKILDTNVSANMPEDPKYLYGKTGLDTESDVTAWKVAYAKEIFPQLRVGLAWEKDYFLKKQIQTTLLKDFATGTIDTSEWHHEGDALDFGVSGSAGAISYAVAGTYPFEGDLTLRRNITKLRATETDADYPDLGNVIHDSTLSTSTSTMQLPPEGRAGLAYALQKNLTAYADYRMVMWDRYYVSDKALTGDFTKAHSIALAADYTPALNKLNPNYFEIITYSTGLSFRTLALEGDKEFSISLGTGLPLGRGGELAVSVESGLRTSDTREDYKEGFINLRLTTGGGQ